MSELGWYWFRYRSHGLAAHFSILEVLTHDYLNHQIICWFLLGLIDESDFFFFFFINVSKFSSLYCTLFRNDNPENAQPYIMIQLQLWSVMCSVKQRAHRLVSKWLQPTKNQLRVIAFCDHQSKDLIDMAVTNTNFPWNSTDHDQFHH